MPQSCISTDSRFEREEIILLSALLHGEEHRLVSIEDDWGDIFVVEEDNYRALKFDEIYEQSKMDVLKTHYPVFEYTKAMLLGVALCPFRDVLLLGLGGGSLVRTLHYLEPDASLTVVEIRPAVIELAFQYFALPVTPSLNVVCQDASYYVCEQSMQVDLIFSDLFWAMQMNPAQTTINFIEGCHRQLRPHGWLVVNYEQKADIDDELVNVLYRYFEDVLVCYIPNGNAVVLAGSLEKSGGMQGFYQRLPHLEACLNCKMDSLGRSLQRAPNHPDNLTNNNR